MCITINSSLALKSPPPCVDKMDSTATTSERENEMEANVVIDGRGTVRRECHECGRWIGTRGYSIRIYRHNGLDGQSCPCTRGKPGDRVERWKR